MRSASLITLSRRWQRPTTGRTRAHTVGHILRRGDPSARVGRTFTEYAAVHGQSLCATRHARGERRRHRGRRKTASGSRLRAAGGVAPPSPPTHWVAPQTRPLSCFECVFFNQVREDGPNQQGLMLGQSCHSSLWGPAKGPTGGPACSGKSSALTARPTSDPAYLRFQGPPGSHK